MGIKIIFASPPSDLSGYAIESALEAFEREFPNIRKVYILKYSICDFNVAESIKKMLGNSANKFLFISRNIDNIHSWELGAYNEDTLENLGIYKSEVS